MLPSLEPLGAASDLTYLMALVLFGAGIAAGVCNALAGGGTLISFPVFLACGLPPVVANASNAVAVWPGHALASIGYRRELQRFSGELLPASLTAVAGGSAGALLLTFIGNAAFVKLIPILLAAATALFAFGPSMQRWLAGRFAPQSGLKHIGPVGHVGILVFSLYGGFFGAGLGVMLISGLLLLGVHDTQHNNALKNLLATAVTSIAVVVLAGSGLIAWPQTLVAFAGALVGGLWGSRLARLLSPAHLRVIIIALGTVLSLYFAHKYYRSI